MYPSLGLCLPCFDGMGPLGIEVCKVYNDWLREYCDAAPDVLTPVALVSVHDVDLAVAEVRRTRALGFPAICLARFPDGRTSADADLEPLWGACEELGTLVAFHPVISNVYLHDPPFPTSSSPFPALQLQHVR